jgi:hypothetical protein
MIKTAENEGKSDRKGDLFIIFHPNLKGYLFFLLEATVANTANHDGLQESTAWVGVHLTRIRRQHWFAADYRTLRFGKQRRYETARCRKGQPQSWNCPVAGNMN